MELERQDLRSTTPSDRMASTPAGRTSWSLFRSIAVRSAAVFSAGTCVSAIVTLVCTVLIMLAASDSGDAPSTTSVLDGLLDLALFLALALLVALVAAFVIAVVLSVVAAPIVAAVCTLVITARPGRFALQILSRVLLFGLGMTGIAGLTLWLDDLMQSLGFVIPIAATVSAAAIAWFCGPWVTRGARPLP